MAIQNSLEDQALEESKKRREEEQKAERDREAKETEWECQYCTQLNFMIYEDINSSSCAKCYKLNYEVYNLIK